MVCCPDWTRKQQEMNSGCSRLLLHILNNAVFFSMSSQQMFWLFYGGLNEAQRALGVSLQG